MTTYYSKPEIKAAMKILVSDYLKNCVECEKLPEDFIDLIKYNFLAKYVSFNRKKHSIEIGVEDRSANGSYYPKIKVYSFSLGENENPWLDSSFKSNNSDLVFYGSLINRRKYNHRNTEVIVM